MGCSSSYLEANNTEINLSKVLTFIDEIETGDFDPKGLEGYREDVYNKPSKEINDRLEKEVLELCSKLQLIDKDKLKDYSLELQLWWRDHQEADKVRVEKELNELKTKEEIHNALDKLTEYEEIFLDFNNIGSMNSQSLCDFLKLVKLVGVDFRDDIRKSKEYIFSEKNNYLRNHPSTSWYMDGLSLDGENKLIELNREIEINKILSKKFK